MRDCYMPLSLSLCIYIYICVRLLSTCLYPVEGQVEGVYRDPGSPTFPYEEPVRSARRKAHAKKFLRARGSPTLSPWV